VQDVLSIFSFRKEILETSPRKVPTGHIVLQNRRSRYNTKRRRIKKTERAIKKGNGKKTFCTAG
jgi:hypothetical protein